MHWSWGPRLLQVIGALSLAAVAVAVEAAASAEFPPPNCGVAPVGGISQRFEELGRKAPASRTPGELVEYAQTLLTLNHIEPLREMMPALRDVSQRLVEEGREMDYLLVEAEYAAQEAAITRSLEEDQTEDGDDSPPARRPSFARVREEAFAAVTGATKLTAEQAARRAILFADRALASGRWRELQEIAKRSQSLPCEAPASLLWRMGTYDLLASYGLGRNRPTAPQVILARRQRAQAVLPRDDPAVLQLLELEAELAIIAKDRRRAQEAIDGLLAFQQTGSAYNHLWGVFVEAGRELVAMGAEDIARAAFVGAMHAEATSVRRRGESAVSGVLHIVDYEAIEGSAATRKELFRAALEDAAIVDWLDPQRYRIELALVQAYEEDRQSDAARGLRRAVYEREYDRLYAVVSVSDSSCDELSKLIREDIKDSELEELARRQVFYERCVIAGPVSALAGAALEPTVIASEFHRYGATERGAEVLMDYRNRLSTTSAATDEQITDTSVAYKAIHDTFVEMGKLVEAGETKSVEAAHMYQLTISRAYSFFEQSSEPWNDVRMVVRLDNALERARTLGRERDVLEHYLRIADRLVPYLRTHEDNTLPINSQLELLIEDATKIAASLGISEVTEALSHVSDSLNSFSSHSDVCELFGQIPLQSWEPRNCVGTQGVSSSSGAPDSKPSLTNAPIAEGFLREARQHAEKLDRTRIPSASELELYRKVMKTLRDEREPASSLAALEVPELQGSVRFIQFVGPFSPTRRADVEVLHAWVQALRRAGTPPSLRAALILECATLGIKAAYMPAADLRVQLMALSSQIKSSDDLMTVYPLDWVTRWEGQWSSAIAEADELVQTYREMRRYRSLDARPVRDAAHHALRGLVRAHRYAEAREFLSDWLQEDEYSVSAMLAEGAFPQSGNTRCVEVMGIFTPVLRECLETYVFMLEQWLTRDLLGNPTDDRWDELSLLAGMTQGEPQHSLAQSVVRIGDARDSEVSRAARTLLRKYRARKELPESYRQLQQYEAMLRAYRKLEYESAAMDASAPQEALKDARTRLTQTRRELEPALQVLEGVGTPSSFDLSALQHGLRADEAVLAYYVGSDAAVGVLIQKTNVQIKPLGLTALNAQTAISAFRASELHSGLSFFDGTFPVEQAYELYLTLFAPFSASLSDGTHLLIDPGPSLQDLPFAALVMEAPAESWTAASAWVPRWLISKHSISVIPQLTAFGPLREAYVASEAERKLFIGGDPQLSYVDRSIGQADQLIGSRAELGPAAAVSLEITELQRRFGVEASAVLKSEAFTERQFTWSNLHEYRTILLATHAVGAARDRPPYVLFTPGTQVDPLDDGHLYPAEAALLSLDANAVILAACRTGTGGERGGGDYNSLISAFATAGARSVIATHWLVDSEVATRVS
ncbi:MAG: CHAT domain-containing protein, partial [Pseudomonadota bacterium]|nr:CHAT domain-containing protein [Pseudomonadota bacterium]